MTDVGYYKDTDTIKELKKESEKEHPPYALRPYSSSSSAIPVFRRITQDHVMRKVVERVYERYYWDFVLFGYSKDEYFSDVVNY